MTLSTVLTGFVAGFLGAVFTLTFSGMGFDTVVAIGLAGVLTGLIGLVANLVWVTLGPGSPS